MIRGNFFRKIAFTATLSGILILVACSSGTSPNSTTPSSLTGPWRDGAATSSICDGAATGLNAVELTFTQRGNTLSGNSVFTNLYDDTVAEGSFSGTLTETRVSGKIDLIDRYGDPRTYDVALEQQGAALIGTLTDRLEQECPDWFYDSWVMEVSLLPKLTTPVNEDPKEPNNSAKQATPLTLGETLDDLTLGQGDVDWFSFTLAKTSVVNVTVELLSAFDGQVWLFSDSEVSRTSLKLNSNGLQTQSSIEALVLQLNSGTHYLAITGGDDDEFEGKHDENGKYKLLVEGTTVPDSAYEPNDSAEQATEISLDFSADDLFIPFADEDWFTFSVTEPSLVTLHAHTEASSHHPEMTLYDESLREIYDAHSGSEITPFLEVGTYFVKVVRSTSPGVLYSLEITGELLPDAAFEPNNTQEQATQLESDFSGIMYLTPEDKDWFTFEVKETSLVTIDLGDNHYNYALFKSGTDSEEVNLYYYTGSPLEELLGGGTYYLLVTEEDANRSYPLSIKSNVVSDDSYEPNNTAEQATKIALDFSEKLHIYGGDEDWFEFTLDSLSAVSSRVTGSDTTLQTSLFNSRLEPIIQARSEIDKLLEPGTYYLSVTGNPYYDRTGASYTLAVAAEPFEDDRYEPNNSLESAADISLFFSERDLSLSKDNPDYYRFTLPEDASLTVVLSGGNFVGSLVKNLYNENAKLVSTFENGGALALSAGTYWLEVKVQGYQYNYGRYNLSVSWGDLPDATFEPNDTFETAADISSLFTESSSSQAFKNRHLTFMSQDEDWYTFEVAEKVRFSLFYQPETSEYPGPVELYDASAKLITTVYTDFLGNTHDLEPGRYYLRPLPPSGVSSQGVSYELSAVAEYFPQDKYEPNDTLSTAAPVALDFSDNDLILTDSGDGFYNPDWFTFTLSERSFVSAALNFRTYAEHEFKVTLLSQSGDTNEVFKEGWDGVLEAGTYYLKVSGSYRHNYELGFGYSLKLSASPTE